MRNAAAALGYAALACWTECEAALASAQALRDYGQNVDSGSLLSIIAMLLFAPAAIVWGVAWLIFLLRKPDADANQMSWVGLVSAAGLIAGALLIKLING
ncbi:hypothetical protein [Lysobacter sp. CA199]|uniref:hypothetical protein n=1 Tax=Lysobacter sp. CA199 TaxID=3455608 RepID=UPI003F8D3981